MPPSYAIISDYFPSGRRGTALGLYNLGPPIARRSASRSAPPSPRRIAGARRSSSSDRSACSRPCWLSWPFASRARRVGRSIRRHGGVRLSADDRDVLRQAGARARRAGERGDADHHLWRGKFFDAFPHARERHDAARGRGLFRACRGNRDERRHRRLRTGDRPLHAAFAASLCPDPRRVPGARDSLLRRLHPGAHLAGRARIPDRPVFPELLLSVVGGHARPGGGAARPARHLGRAAVAGHEF